MVEEDDLDPMQRVRGNTHAKLKRQTRKILLVGSAKSGKSMLVKRFLDNTFSSEYAPTIEDCFNRDITHKGFNLNLDFIDMCGSSMFPAMLDLNIKKADIIMLTYEVGNKSSTEEAEILCKKIRSLRSGVTIVLTGTKLDLHPEYEDVGLCDILNEYDSTLQDLYENHILTSAKTSTNVQDAFEIGFDRIVRRINALSMSALKEEKKSERNFCCNLL